MEPKHRLIAIRFPDDLPETEPLVMIPHTTFDQAREALKDCSVELKEYLESCGDCDHSVGVCVCGLKRLIEDVDGITAAMEDAGR